MSLSPDSETPSTTPPSGTHEDALCLRDHFLISMPHMHDGSFAQSLTYICDHNEHGAMGIIINRPMDLSFQALLSHLEIDADHEATPQPVYAGGPVQTDKGFVLHLTTEQEWLSSYDVSDNVSITSSLDILEDLANNEQQTPCLVALGYAGWGAGQLEEEIRQNA